MCIAAGDLLRESLQASKDISDRSNLNVALRSSLLTLEPPVPMACQTAFGHEFLASLNEAHRTPALLNKTDRRDTFSKWISRLNW